MGTNADPIGKKSRIRRVAQAPQTERLIRSLPDPFGNSFGTTKLIETMPRDVAAAEMMALPGPSGCGRATTLFAICAIHQVTGGRILFGDRDLSDMPGRQRNVGVVFQSSALCPQMTLAQNISFPLQINGMAQVQVKRGVATPPRHVHQRLQFRATIEDPQRPHA